MLSNEVACDWTYDKARSGYRFHVYAVGCDAYARWQSALNEPPGTCELCGNNARLVRDGDSGEGES